MSKITGMVPEDRRRRSRLQSTHKTEASSPISTTTPAPSLESPILTDLNEANPIETGPSDIIIFFYNKI